MTKKQDRSKDSPVKSAFDFTGPSIVVAAAPELRRKPADPMRVNRYSPPVRGAVASVKDDDKTRRILGRSNSARSQ